MLKLQVYYFHRTSQVIEVNELNPFHDVAGPSLSGLEPLLDKGQNRNDRSDGVKGVCASRGAGPWQQHTLLTLFFIDYTFFTASTQLK